MAATRAAQAACDDAYALHDAIYATQEAQDAAMEAAQARALAAVDAAEAAAETQQKDTALLARLRYLRGKACASTADGQGSAEAETLLADAVKLDPLLVDAWNCLGECFWARGEFPLAMHTLKGALAHRRDPATLCKLSQLLRAMGAREAQKGDAQQKEKHLVEARKMAKEAVGLAPASQLCWKHLGFCHFKIYGDLAPEADHLIAAKKAFTQAHRLARAARAKAAAAADADGGGSPTATGSVAPAPSAAMEEEFASDDADLCVTHANTCAALEEFGDAQRLYARADEIDGVSMAGAQSRQMVWSFALRVQDFLDARCGIKPRKIASLIQEVPAAQPSSLAALAAGANPGVSLTVVVIAPAPACAMWKHDAFVVVDHKGGMALVACYWDHVVNGVPTVKGGALLQLLEPNVVVAEAAHPDPTADRAVAYRSIHIDKPKEQLRINGLNGEEAKKGAPPRRLSQ